LGVEKSFLAGSNNENFEGQFHFQGGSEMHFIRNSLNRLKPKSSCCGTENNTVDGGHEKIALVGSPNVGKSVLFNNLTGRYVTVSNYPGTTVEVSKGKALIEDQEYEIIDTPGMYSFSPITEEERVSRRILVKENPYLVIHVADAKNLERMIPLTFQLIEASLPTILVLNMMDEAEEAGIEIDVKLLEKELGIPVVGTVSTTGVGTDILRRRIKEHAREPKGKL
jgi:ferrous iron transport protein B